MDRTSIRFLCCPQCSATLIDTPDDRLDCSGCSLSYPIRDGVPVLLIGEATSRPTPTDAEFEHLISKAARFPAVAVAAEGYASNVPLARQRLEPLGVQVVRTDENCHNSRGPQPGNRWPQRRLPFAADTFDLVLAHRAAFSPREAARVLRSGGK